MNGQAVPGQVVRRENGVEIWNIAHSAISVGAHYNGGMNGYLDEIRISNIARSAGWIATGYANQTAPTTFYTVGAQQ